MKPIYVSIAGVVIFGAFSAGCTKQSKEDYGQAGQSLKNAAVDTGKGIKTDVKVAGKAAQNAANAAKNTTEKAKDDKSHK